MGAGISGNLYNHEEGVQTGKTGKDYLRFRLGRKPSKDEDMEFHSCTAFGYLASALAALPKGTRIVLDGRWEDDVWTKRDGTQVNEKKFLAFDGGVSMKFPPDGGRSGPAHRPAARPAQPSAFDPSDVPF